MNRILDACRITIAARHSTSSSTGSTGNARNHAHGKSICRAYDRIYVPLLLITQACLSAYSATRDSPTHLEAATLVSGISHWQFGRFELYRVNPPLVRIVAAWP